MNILEAMISIGIQPESSTSKYGWFEAPGHTVGRPEVFASALFNQWWNVQAPEHHGDTYMLASYLLGVTIDEAAKMLGPVDPMKEMPNRDHIKRSHIEIEDVRPIETDTAKKAVMKSEVPFDKTLQYCKDYKYTNNGVKGLRVFGLWNMSGGIVSLDFSGKHKDPIARDVALIPGDGSKAGTCILVVGIKEFLRLDEVAEDVALLPSSNILNRAIPFLAHYEIIDCVCQAYYLIPELRKNIPSAQIRVSHNEPHGLWDGTLFADNE